MSMAARHRYCRSSVPERELARWSSARIVPESTFITVIGPYGSAMVLNTKASGSALGSGTTPIVVLPAITSTGGRSSGAGPLSQRKAARLSIAIPCGYSRRR